MTFFYTLFEQLLAKIHTLSSRVFTDGGGIICVHELKHTFSKWLKSFY